MPASQKHKPLPVGEYGKNEVRSEQLPEYMYVFLVVDAR
jgi:hypothetical protein